MCLTVSYLVAGTYKQCCTLPTPAGSRVATNERPNSACSILRGTQMSLLLLELGRLLLHFLWKMCKCFVCLCAGHVTHRRACWTPPTRMRWRERSRDPLDPHTQKNTCLFARMQFTGPEIPSEPVTGVQEGTRMVVRGCSATYFCRRSLTHSSLPTPSATSKIDTRTLIKSSDVFPYQSRAPPPPRTPILCFLCTR